MAQNIFLHFLAMFSVTVVKPLFFPNIVSLNLLTLLNVLLVLLIFSVIFLPSVPIRFLTGRMTVSPGCCVRIAWVSDRG